MLEPHTCALTPRLEVRCPTELDRPRFVELFCDDAFMAFSGGPLAADQAKARFDRMLAPMRRALLREAADRRAIVRGRRRLHRRRLDRVRRRPLAGVGLPTHTGSSRQGLRHRSEPRPPRSGEPPLHRRTTWDHPPRQPGLPERDSQAPVRVLETGTGARRPSQPLPTPGLTRPQTRRSGTVCKVIDSRSDSVSDGLRRVACGGPDGGRCGAVETSDCRFGGRAGLGQVCCGRD
jgi:hypothetical protein